MNRKSKMRGSRKNRARRDNSGINLPGRMEKASIGPQIRVRRSVSSTNSITLVPSTGLVISGLTTSYVIGISVSALGANWYNTSVGPSVLGSVSFPDASSYTAIFDYYRILKVRVTGWFQNDTSSISSVSTGMPLFYTAVDYDSSGAPTTALAVLEYATSKVSQAAAMGKPAFVHTFQPRAINTLNSSILTTQFASLAPPGTWIDTTTGGAPHYGMFIAWDPQSQSSSSSIGCLTLIFEMEIEYKGAR
jgi:hypothetical protein